MQRKILCLATAAAAVTGGVVFAVPASAAQSTQSLDCGGTTVTIRTNNNNSSEMGGWSAAQIVDGGTGHLIPTSFTFGAYDDTTQQMLFEGTQVKGNGNANRNQGTVTCTQTQTATLADLMEPGDQLPPGASPTDQVTVTFTATAVPEP